MIRSASFDSQPPGRRHRGDQPRRGATILELIVGMILLTVLTTVVGRCTASAMRLSRQIRYRQLALEELSNQSDRLRGIDAASRTSAMQSIEPSPWAREALPNPTLSAEPFSDELGDRIQLEIEWESVARRQRLQLIAWINPQASDASDPPQASGGEASDGNESGDGPNAGATPESSEGAEGSTADPDLANLSLHGSLHAFHRTGQSR